MAEPRVKRWTIADLDALPETTDGWRNRYEISDGELFVSRGRLTLTDPAPRRR